MDAGLEYLKDKFRSLRAKRKTQTSMAPSHRILGGRGVGWKPSGNEELGYNKSDGYFYYREGTEIKRKYVGRASFNSAGVNNQRYAARDGTLFVEDGERPGEGGMMTFGVSGRVQNWLTGEIDQQGTDRVAQVRTDQSNQARKDIGTVTTILGVLVSSLPSAIAAPEFLAGMAGIAELGAGAVELGATAAEIGATAAEVGTTVAEVGAEAAEIAESTPLLSSIDRTAELGETIGNSEIPGYRSALNNEEFENLTMKEKIQAWEGNAGQGGTPNTVATAAEPVPVSTAAPTIEAETWETIELDDLYGGTHPAVERELELEAIEAKAAAEAYAKTIPGMIKNAAWEVGKDLMENKMFYTTTQTTGAALWVGGRKIAGNNADEETVKATAGVVTGAVKTVIGHSPISLVTNSAELAEINKKKRKATDEDNSPEPSTKRNNDSGISQDNEPGADTLSVSKPASMPTSGETPVQTSTTEQVVTSRSSHTETDDHRQAPGWHADVRFDREGFERRYQF